MPTSSHEVLGVDEPALPPHAENPDGMLIPSGMFLPAVVPALSGAETEPPVDDPPVDNPPVNDPPEEPPPVEGLLPGDDRAPDWPEGDVCEDEVLCTSKSDAHPHLLQKCRKPALIISCIYEKCDRYFN